jgi:hypothetical protein
MARDPFAPVTQPSIPPWIWLVAGTFAVLLIGMGAIVMVMVSRRPAPPAVATPTSRDPVAPSTAVAAPGDKTGKAAQDGKTAVATAASPDKAADKANSDDDADKDERHRHGHHKHGGKGQAAPAKESAAPLVVNPAKPAKKKVDMSQKEIDNLLGL